MWRWLCVDGSGGVKMVVVAEETGVMINGGCGGFLFDYGDFY